MFTRLAAVMAVLAAAPAGADVVHWKSVGYWDISYFPSDHGCSASTAYEKGISFDIGVSTNSSGAYLIVYLYNSAWTSIEDGKSYPLTVQFGHSAPWNIDMNGQVVDGDPALSFSHDFGSKEAQNFMTEFMQANSMEWTYNGTSLGVLSLRGSSAALREAVNCTKSYLDAAGSSDPFSGSPDPFR